MRKTQLVITKPFEKLKQEKITFTDITLLRLMKLGADALALYIHYCLSAKLQSKTHGKYVNPVKATSGYSMKGLNMTKARFHKAKRLLLDNGFIEDYEPRNEKGQVEGHYIRIHYFLKSTVDTESTSEVHPPRNPEGGLSTGWEIQTVENQATNTNDKKGNTIDKNINTNNNSSITSEQDTLAMQDTNAPESSPASTHNFMRGNYEDNIMTGNPKLPTQEEQKAQEIIDAIKTNCGLDLKDPKKWNKQVPDIAQLQQELPRDTEDFVMCVKNLQKNQYYKEISLNLVLKKIRLMPTNAMRTQDTAQEEAYGLSEDEFWQGYFIHEAQRNHTTPEFEKEIRDKQLKAREEAMARGEPV